MPEFIRTAQRPHRHSGVEFASGERLGGRLQIEDGAGDGSRQRTADERGHDECEQQQRGCGLTQTERRQRASIAGHGHELEVFAVLAVQHWAGTGQIECHGRQFDKELVLDVLGRRGT